MTFLGELESSNHLPNLLKKKTQTKKTNKMKFYFIVFNLLIFNCYWKFTSIAVCTHLAWKLFQVFLGLLPF